MSLIVVATSDYNEAISTFDYDTGALLATRAYTEEEDLSHESEGLYYVVGIAKIDDESFVVAGMAAAGSNNYQLWAFDKDLNVLWRYGIAATAVMSSSRPVVANGVAYYGTIAQNNQVRVVAVDATTGNLIWDQYPIAVPDSPTGVPNSIHLAHDGTNLWMGQADYVTVLDSNAGTVIDQFHWDLNASVTSSGVRLAYNGTFVVGVLLQESTGVVYGQGFYLNGSDILNSGAFAIASTYSDGGPSMLYDIEAYGARLAIALIDVTTDDMGGTAILVDSQQASLLWNEFYNLSQFISVAQAPDGVVLGLTSSEDEMPLAYLVDVTDGSLVRTFGSAAAGGDWSFVTVLDSGTPDPPDVRFYEDEGLTVDGLDLGLMPTRFRMDPVERSARASGMMGNVHFLWPKWRRAMYLTLMFEDMRTEEAQTLLGVFGPRTDHNKVLALKLNRPEQVFWIPGGVNLDLDYSDTTGRWNVEMTTPALVYAETGDFLVRTRLFNLPTDDDVALALYRYEHLYILQDNQNLTIIDPEGAITTLALSFMPNTWASYGGTVYLYRDFVGESDEHPGGPMGIIEFIGANYDLYETHTNDYYRVYRDVIVRGGTIIRDPLGAFEDETEIDFSWLSANGLPYQYTNVWGMTDANHLRAFDYIQKSFFRTLPVSTPIPDRPVFAQYEANGHLLWLQQDAHASWYNGMEGRVLYSSDTTLYDQMVPYMYPDNGILAVGFPGGYYFSPDMGISWRRRNLNGWGVLTESGILTVSGANGVVVEQGVW